MSKGFHRLAEAQPWDNRTTGGYPLPIHKGAIMDAETAFDAPAQMTVDAAEFEPGPPKMTRDQATSMGFTGNSCTCGSMMMVRNGTCEKCTTCGSTTGCS